MRQKLTLGGRRAASVQVRLGVRSYPVEIGKGILSRFGKRMRELRPDAIGTKVAVVTNPLLLKLYGKPLIHTLQAEGFAVTTIVVPAGERTKDLSWVGRIIDKLVAEKFERRSALIALGGGVIGDLTGFAASVYLRGIPYIHVPTTVIAQVDSSVGGKTAVNHAKGKNLIGAFYQPKLVFIDVEVLNSLDQRELISGLAEVIKYGVIADARLFRFLETNMERILGRDPDVWLHLVKRSCEIKASVVSMDEREGGRRRILNYGHTLGHAIETATNYRWYTHGEAIAIGMAFASQLSVEEGCCGATTAKRQRDLLVKAGLPTAMPGLPSAAVMQAIDRDKKVVAEKVNVVLVDRIGRVRVETVEKRQIRHTLKNASQSPSPRSGQKTRGAMARHDVTRRTLAH